MALCPQVDVASQGLTVAEARENLAGALTLFGEPSSFAVRVAVVANGWSLPDVGLDRAHIVFDQT